MRQPVDTGRRENPLAPERLERVLLVGTRLRGRHYGQRSCVPHQQVEHMAAPTRLSGTSDQPLPTESRPHMALSSRGSSFALGSRSTEDRLFRFPMHRSVTLLLGQGSRSTKTTGQTPCFGPAAYQLRPSSPFWGSRSTEDWSVRFAFYRSDRRVLAFGFAIHRTEL